MSRKTYEKAANINGMFNVLEQQIIHSKDMANLIHLILIVIE
jgi:hypothetical protein